MLFELSKKHSIRFILLAVLVLFFVQTIIPNSAQAANQYTNLSTSKPKMINLVIDDSGSMSDPDNRMCFSKYALEVFTAQMGKNDIMNLYSLNTNYVQTLYGTDLNRVNSVHERVINPNDGTPFDQVENAGDALLKENGNTYDRWLIVITDGDFSGSNSSHQRYFNDLNKKGVYTSFLRIASSGSNPFTGNPSNGGYSDSASTRNDIVEKVVDISNRVFKHQILPAKHISSSNSNYTLNIDIPVSQIIVFAQGGNVSVGDLSDGNQTYSASEIHDVRYDNKYSYVDKSLTGKVVKFDPGTSLFEGNYSVPVSGGDKLVFYYEPAVMVDCALSQDGNEINKNSSILTGKYQVSGRFIHPITGKQITSDLLNGATITLSIDNNGKKKDFSANSGSITLEDGTATLTATATFDGYVSISNSATYTILKTSAGLQDPNANPNDAMFSIRQDLLLHNKTTVFSVQIVDSITKEAVDSVRWKNSTITIPSADGINWSCKISDICPFFDITPSSNGKYTDIKPGTYQFNAIVTNTADGAKTDNILTLAVLPYEPIKVDDMTRSFKQNDFSGNGQNVEFIVKDKYNNDAPVSAEVWKHVTLDPIPDSHGLHITSDRSKDGVYTFTIQSVDGMTRSVEFGDNLGFDLNFVYDDGDLVYEQTAKLILNIERLPPKQLDCSVNDPIEHPQSRFHQDQNMPIEVTLLYQGSPLTPAQFALLDEKSNVRITVRNNKRIAFNVEKSVQNSVLLITPTPYHNRGYVTDPGEIIFELEASIDHDDEWYLLDTTISAQIKPELFWVILEWFWDHRLLFIAIFLACAYYFCKPRINTRTLYVCTTIKNNSQYMPRYKKIHKRLSTVICPFKAEEADLDFYDSNAYCTFPSCRIIAVGKRRDTDTFRFAPSSQLSNLKFEKYSIQDSRVKNVEYLYKMQYPLNGFRIKCLNTNLKKVGIITVCERAPR